MSELDELRSQNKELKRLLENALDLLEKSRSALAGRVQSREGAARPKRFPAAPKKVAKKKKRP